MIIGKVVGNVVATRKCDKLVGYKLLVVKPINYRIDEEYLVAVDKIGAGIGEMVLVTLGSAAYKGLKEENAPIDAAVVGIIDTTDIKE